MAKRQGGGRGLHCIMHRRDSASRQGPKGVPRPVCGRAGGIDRGAVPVGHGWAGTAHERHRRQRWHVEEEEQQRRSALCAGRHEAALRKPP